MTETKKCFVIMPITTPPNMLETYRDGEEHFKHVFECLFSPAVKNAGYEPIPPGADGSNLIQASIIQNLQNSDLVLCDISCLNPNVFFEFGIRTALNKPICVVKDELVVKIPFDTGILHHHDYQSSIEPWILDDEIKKLTAHINASAKSNKTLWKYFGMEETATAYIGGAEPDDKLDYLGWTIESLKDKIESLAEHRNPVSLNPKDAVDTDFDGQDAAINYIYTSVPPGINIRSIAHNSNDSVIDVYYNGHLTTKQMNDAVKRVKRATGYRAIYHQLNSTSREH